MYFISKKRIVWLQSVNKFHILAKSQLLQRIEGWSRMSEERNVLHFSYHDDECVDGISTYLADLFTGVWSISLSICMVRKLQAIGDDLNVITVQV